MDGFLPTWRKVFNGDEFDLFLQSGNFLGVSTIRVVIYRNHVAIIDYRLLIAVLPCSAFRIPYSAFPLPPITSHASPLSRLTALPSPNTGARYRKNTVFNSCVPCLCCVGEPLSAGCRSALKS